MLQDTQHTVGRDGARVEPVSCPFGVVRKPCRGQGWQPHRSLLRLPHLPQHPAWAGRSCSNRKVCALAADTVWAAEAKAGQLPGMGLPRIWGGPRSGSPVPASSAGPENHHLVCLRILRGHWRRRLKAYKCFNFGFLCTMPLVSLPPSLQKY